MQIKYLEIGLKQSIQYITETEVYETIFTNLHLSNIPPVQRLVRRANTHYRVVTMTENKQKTKHLFRKVQPEAKIWFDHPS